MGRGSWNGPGAASSSRWRNHHQHARPEPSRGLRHQRGHEVRSGSEAYRRADAADHQPDAEKPDGMDPQATAEPRRAGTDHVTDTRHNHAIDLATESEAMASRNARPTRDRKSTRLNSSH